jgi:transitional endoplasmic reticulum ATPase
MKMPAEAKLVKDPTLNKTLNAVNEIAKEIEKKEAAAKSLANAKTVTQVAEVERAGTAITIPEGMSISSALGLLVARAQYEEEDVSVTMKIDCFPWDGAVALHRVLTEVYGWARAVPTPGFFGPTPPQMRTVQTGVNSSIQVPWGRFELPNIRGNINTGFETNHAGCVIFNLVANVKRESEATVKALFDRVKAEALAHSIYRGKAIRMRFLDDDGDAIDLPEPQFMDVDKYSEDQLVYSDDVQRAIETTLFTPIKRVHDCINNGIPLKRGVLLGGPFGTGKTLAASVAAKLAVDAGITYLYVPRGDELARALAFARQYQSPACVVFCEDIDRVTAGDRSVEMDDILNIIDGIDSKGANIIVVLTTNELEKINPAMLRPGRLDAVINVTPPDAKAAERLLRLYGKGVIPDHVNLDKAGKLLAGKIPAILAEVVKRAKLAQLKYTTPGEKIVEVSEDAVVDAATAMSMQIDILDRHINGTKPEKIDTIAESITNAVRAGLNGSIEAIETTRGKVEEIHEQIM